jgi:hypothetical protein
MTQRQSTFSSLLTDGVLLGWPKNSAVGTRSTIKSTEALSKAGFKVELARWEIGRDRPA